MADVMHAFHPGERQVQQKVGVPERTLASLSKFVRPAMPEQHREFFQRQAVLYVAVRDLAGSLLAGMLVGTRGMITTPDEKSFNIHLNHTVQGTLAMHHFQPGTLVGILALEHSTRRRNRLNGRVASVRGDTVEIAVDESFGNCPKYIQKRNVSLGINRPGFLDRPGFPCDDSGVRCFPSLQGGARDLVARCDTFFLATAAFEMSEAPSGADMSHRGGPAGFVKVAADGKSVRWADYKGNSMYMSLGNITHNSGISLLFVDYEKGSSVHAEGHARILWNEKDLPGAERVCEVVLTSCTYYPEGFWPITAAPVAEWSPYLPG